MGKDDEEKITISKAELEKMLTDRETKGKRTPEETKFREAIREEIGEVIDQKLADFFDTGDGGSNDGGGSDGGFWTGLAKAFGESK